jgi:hypothetical protein
VNDSDASATDESVTVDGDRRFEVDDGDVGAVVGKTLV